MRVFAVLALVAFLGSGCAAPQSEPGETVTLTTTQTVTVAPPPPPETDEAYAGRLTNASVSYLGILEVYLDGANDAYADGDYTEAAWSASRGANESARYARQLNGTSWVPTGNATAPFHAAVLSFALSEERFMRDVQLCAEGHARGMVAPECGRVNDDVKANNRNRQLMMAEAERWDPTYGAQLA